MQKMSTAPQRFDSVRAARMGGYGFCFYGPYQNFWYGLLDKFFPTKSLSHFGAKVCIEPFRDLQLMSVRHCPPDCAD